MAFAQLFFLRHRAFANFCPKMLMPESCPEGGGGGGGKEIGTAVIDWCRSPTHIYSIYAKDKNTHTRRWRVISAMDKTEFKNILICFIGTALNDF